MKFKIVALGLLITSVYLNGGCCFSCMNKCCVKPMLRQSEKMVRDMEPVMNRMSDVADRQMDRHATVRRQVAETFTLRQAQATAGLNNGSTFDAKAFFDRQGKRSF